MKKVIAFGTFDGLHPGHEYYLKKAKSYGDHLTVVIARDVTVEKVKGRLPKISEEERRRAVEELPYVDRAIIGHAGDKHKVLEEVQPDVICLGYDQRSFIEKLPPAKVIRIDAYNPQKYKSSKLRSKDT